jgi:hypothetical protein
MNILCNFYNLHKLFTKEDSNYYNIHKILGTISIINYTYRIYLWYNYDKMFILPNMFNITITLFHALLSSTSLIFKLSSKRIRVTPIIWPEGRLHSIIFAYRSIFIIYIFFLYWYTHIKLLNYLRGVIVFITILLADKVTNYYKLQLKTLDENDSSMRRMPYPSFISSEYMNILNIFYSISQIFATMNCIFSINIDRIFLLLFPIQIAMFLMTLSKKNIITTFGWHFWYTMSLLLNFFIQINTINLNLNKNECIIFFSLGTIFTILRLKYNINKYYLWSSIIMIHWILLYNETNEFIIPYSP